MGDASPAAAQGPVELIPFTCNEIQALFIAPRRARVMKITFCSWSMSTPAGGVCFAAAVLRLAAAAAAWSGSVIV
ncbi:hypothetical protein ACWFR5_47245 [Streptomyces sp. NPDC055092]